MAGMDENGGLGRPDLGLGTISSMTGVLAPPSTINTASLCNIKSGMCWNVTGGQSSKHNQPGIQSSHICMSSASEIGNVRGYP